MVASPPCHPWRKLRHLILLLPNHLLLPTQKREDPAGYDAEKDHQENPPCLVTLFLFLPPPPLFSPIPEVLPLAQWALSCSMQPLVLLFRAALVTDWNAFWMLRYPGVIGLYLQSPSGMLIPS